MRKLKNEELNRLSVDEYKTSTKNNLIVVLDNIRSLNNIGSIFRTGDAFRIKEIHLCGITAQPPHREIRKTALGATESVDWSYYSETKESIFQLKEMGYTVLAIEQIDTSTDLANFKPDQGKKYGLIFGNEINGISQDILSYVDQCIEIPQFGTKHSFNISVSAGIVLWHLFIKSL
ncbi:MAG: RNA methyltransferase [Bacteroidales bacterium]|nr:RNA methyltransferase [Bacteroidales bacterium]MCF8405804.1 RNA methyltransferase [Bacteroidales bacterium]